MPEQRIQFFSDGIKFSLRERSSVRKWIESIARTHKRKVQGLTYIFVSDQQLLKINRQFLHHNTLTDIITFPSDCGDGLVCGEIYISIDRIRENAKAFKQPIRNELHRVMAHGLLHLCGFKDKTAAEQKVMRRQEEKALDLRSF